MARNQRERFFLFAVATGFLLAIAWSVPAQQIMPALAGTPTGIAFDPVTNSWFVVTTNPPELSQIDPLTGTQQTAPHNLAVAGLTSPYPLTGIQGPGQSISLMNLGLPVLVYPPSSCSPSTIFPGVCPPYNPTNPTGAALDFFSNTLYITDNQNGSLSRIIVIKPGADGVLQTGDDEVGQWFTVTYNPPLLSPEGITFNPLTRTLFVLDQVGLMVYELSTSGVQNSVANMPPPTGLPVGLTYDPTSQNILMLTNTLPPSPNLFQFPPAPGGAGVPTISPIASSTINAGGLTGVAYNTAAGSVFGVNAGGVVSVGPAPTPGPGNGGPALAANTGAILSDGNACTGGGICMFGTTGPGAVLFVPAASPAAITFTISDLGQPPQPSIPPHLSDMYRITTTPISGVGPWSIMIPLLNQGVPGAPFGLFDFGGPQAVNTFMLPVKAFGSVDPSGMTITFRGLGFLSFVTVIPLDVPPEAVAAIITGGLDPIIRSFGLPQETESKLLEKLGEARDSLESPDPEVRNAATDLLRDFLRQVEREVAAGTLSAGQAQVLAGTVETLLNLLEACSPRSQGFWKHQCSDHGFHQVPPEELDQLFFDVEQLERDYPECFSSTGCELLTGGGRKNDPRLKAEQQFLALLLNQAFGRLNDFCPADNQTVGEVIVEIGAILCDPLASDADLEQAKDSAEAVNVSGEDLELAAISTDLSGQAGATLSTTIALINMSGWAEDYALTAEGTWVRAIDSYPFIESLPMQVDLSKDSLPNVKAGEVVLLSLEVVVPSVATEGDFGSVKVRAVDLDSTAGLQRSLSFSVTATAPSGGGGMKEDDDLGLIKGKTKP